MLSLQERARSLCASSDKLSFCYPSLATEEFTLLDCPLQIQSFGLLSSYLLSSASPVSSASTATGRTKASSPRSGHLRLFVHGSRVHDSFGQYTAGQMAKNEESTPKRVSCSTCFDALWFCYSPVHQMQQYYRLGVLDNCSEKWSALWDCLSLKTKPSSQVQEILETREKEKPHIWTFRTREEAQSHWKELFGHLDDME